MNGSGHTIVLAVAPDDMTGTRGCQTEDFLGRMPNLGVRYLASALERHGHDVVTLDCQHDHVAPLLLAARINAGQPSLVGMTLYDATMRSTKKVLELLRLTYCGPIVVGGYTATFHAEEILDAWPEVDYVIVREGEHALAALVEHVTSGAPVEDVPNLVYRVDGRPRRTRAESLVDVTTIPWPRREWPESGDVTPIIARRGCLSRCTFCSMVPFYDTTLGPIVRRRTAPDIADEVVWCADHGSREFMFYDDDFGLSTPGDRDFARELAGEFRRRHLDIHWGIELRVADVIRGEDVLRELCDVGLTHISLGMESLLPRQLKLYNKGYRQQDVFQAIDIARTLPLDFQTNVIFWDPWLTLDEALEHVALLDRIRIQEQLGSANFPFFGGVLLARRGTALYEKMRVEGMLRQRPDAFWEYEYDFVDPDVREFRAGPHREFMRRVRATDRPQALWLFVPRLEHDGQTRVSRALRTYAAAVAAAELDYYRALLTASRTTRDAAARQRLFEAVHADHAPRVDRCATLLPQTIPVPARATAAARTS